MVEEFFVLPKMKANATFFCVTYTNADIDERANQTKTCDHIVANLDVKVDLWFADSKGGRRRV